MANLVYDSAKANFMGGQFNLSADTINVALLSGAYTPTSAEKYYANIVAYEVAGTGYTAGGATLSSTVVSADYVNSRGVFDAGNVTWSSSTLTANAAVVYKDDGAGMPLILYIDFGSDKSSSNGDFVIQWNANGILTLN